MKNNKLLMTLALCLGLSPIMNFCGEKLTPVYQRTTPTTTQPAPTTPSQPTTTTPSWYSPVTWWQTAKTRAHGAASYVPGYTKAVDRGYITAIKDYSATRLLATLSAVVYGLAQAGYNYEKLFAYFMTAATAVYDKTTVANVLKSTLVALIGSAAVADWAASMPDK